MSVPKFELKPNSFGSKNEEELKKEKGIKKRAEKREEEFVAVKDLPSEDKRVFEGLEKKSQGLYRSRSQLQDLYSQIKDILPTKRTKAGSDVAIGLAEFYKLAEEGRLAELVQDNIEEKAKKEAEDSLGKENKSDHSVLVATEANIDNDVSNIEETLQLYDLIKEDDDLELIRKYENTDGFEEKKKIFQSLGEEQKMKLKYKWFRLREMAEKKRELNTVSERIDFIKEKKLYARKQNLFGALRKASKEYKEVFEKYHSIIYSSPEAYLYEGTRRLREAKNVLDENGSIIETPYVKEQMAYVKGILESGRPCFVHGELGTGKTELAKHLIRKELSVSHLKRWGKQNPKPEDAKELKDWKTKREKQKEAIVIGGHKNIDISEFFGGRGFERKFSMDDKEKTELIIKKLKNFKDEHLDMEEKELDSAMDIYKRSLEKSLENPIEVIPILGKMYQAMKEGRPLLIDEMNAIPHTILIAFNDLLNLKAGDNVTPSIIGMDSFTVQEGFSVIATGNWKPEDGKMYVGRQAIDAAFLSRFGLVQYDYLPMMTEETPDASDEIKRQERSQNELYFILISKLLDDSLGAELPKDALEKIKGLAKCARIIQDIFSEKSSTITFKDENGSEFSGKELERFLSENVLSNRHLIPIIEKWKKDGFTRPIDDYIFLEYLDKSKSRPKEMMLLYQILQTQSGENLFAKSDDWPDGQDGKGLQDIVEYNITDRIYGVQNLTEKEKPIEIEVDMEYYSPEDIIKEVFGPVPKRVDVPKKFFEKEDEVEEDEKPSEEIINLIRNKRKEEKEMRDIAEDILADADLEFEGDEEEKLQQIL